MRKSNVDISRLPSFTSLEEAVDYFRRFGELKFYGWETPAPMYAIYSYKSKGLEYFISITPSGEVSVTQRGAELRNDF
ncbi:hypothetical protein ASD40_01720 [Paenibacillus sp. Root444D2]|nr:hypothetical protein ASD40_01720 [Paenibacillus sp. Root444D2]